MIGEERGKYRVTEHMWLQSRKGDYWRDEEDQSQGGETGDDGVG